MKERKNNLQFIYHIFIDRFSTGDDKKDKLLSFCHTTKDNNGDYSQNFLGGNLKGIIRRVSYIKNLGVDAIWISPFYKTSAYHGYHITDFFSIDKRFGNDEDLRGLVKICHKNNIKVILDFVPNHCSRYHPYFLEAQRNCKSTYKEWFVFKKWPNKYLCFLDFADLPKFNLENQDCRKYILEAATYWIKEFDIDGYRIDHAIGVPLDFWEDLKKEIASVKKDFFLIPEIWFSGIKAKHLNTFWFLRKEGSWMILDYIKLLFSSNQKRQERAYKILLPCFNAFFDFTLSEYIRENWKNNEKVRNFVEKRKNLYTSKKNYIFLDNHDMSRFIFLCKNDLKEYRKVLELLFSLERPVVFYYGAEIALAQENYKDFDSHQDKEFRRFMKWDIDEDEKHTLSLFKKKIQENSK